MPKTTPTIDWGLDHLSDIISPLSNVSRVAAEQAFSTPNVKRAQTLLAACNTSRDRLDNFIAELEAYIAENSNDS